MISHALVEKVAVELQGEERLQDLEVQALKGP